MAIQLKPGSYKNLKYSVTPDNIIDTIKIAPITNAYQKESSVLATETITSADIDGTTYLFSNLEHSGSQVESFDNIDPTYRRCVYQDDFAKSRTDVLMYSGSVLFQFEQPIKENVSATVSMSWTSSHLEKDSSISWDDSPSFDDLNNDNYSLASYIRGISNSKDSGNWTFDSDKFSSNPIAYPDPESQSDIQNAIFITNIFGSGFIQGPSILDWQETSNYTLSGTQFQYLDTISSSFGLRMTDDNISIVANCTKIDDYKVQVDYTVPIRFSYFALTRNYYITGFWQVDSWAFVDRISSLQISLNGISLDSTKNEKAYSLDNNLQLTENIKNNSIYSIDSNELLTLGTVEVTEKDAYSIIAQAKTTYGYAVVSFEGIAPTFNKDYYWLSPDKGVILCRFFPLDTTYNNFITSDSNNFMTKNGETFLVKEGNFELQLLDDYYKENFPIAREQILYKNLNYFYIKISELFLKKFKSGKYIVNLDVPAKWAIENDIHINSQLNIIKQNGEYIKRKGVTSLFEVKTITKILKNTEYTYSLGLMEV